MTTVTLPADLAEKLVTIAPQGLSRVFYSDSGSEAVEIALKMAFQYWAQKGRPEKKKFARLVNAYHGDTIGSVSVGGIDLFHKKSDQQVRQVLFMRGKRVVTFTCKDTKKSFAATLNGCNEIAKSFQWSELNRQKSF